MPRIPTRHYRIGFFLVDDMLATAATLPAEMLHAAQSAADANWRRGYQLEVFTLSTARAPVRTRAGFPMLPDYTLADAPTADIIYLPALWRNPNRIIQRYAEVLPWLREAHAAGTRIAAVGTGCCFLAAAGLLDGKPATTHWHYFEAFEAQYPRVKLKRDYFITQADDIYCAASVNSLADLTVHFLHLLYGSSIAHHIERHFSHEIRRAYESMRYYEGSTDRHTDETIMQTQLWLQDHYHQAVNLGELAAQFDMSVRSFNRRFKHATGKTPLAYLQEIRLGTARDLLQTSNLSISEIAYRVGYQDLGHFTQLFKKFFNATPHDYRTTVRAKLFSVSS